MILWFLRASQAATFVVVAALWFVLLIGAAVVHAALGSPHLPGFVPVVGTCLLFVVAFLVVDRWVYPSRRTATSGEPLAAGEVEINDLDMSWPRGLPRIRWFVVPSVAVVLMVPWDRGLWPFVPPGAYGFLTAIPLALEIPTAALLIFVALGRATDRVGSNDLILHQAYCSRRSVSLFRSLAAPAILLVGVVAVQLAQIFGLITDAGANAIGGAVVGAGLLCWLSLLRSGRPRGLVPSILRQTGPLRWSDDVPSAPYAKRGRKKLR